MSVRMSHWPLAAVMLLISIVSRADTVDEVDAVLDAFHAAAARADAETYLALLTQDIVFLGTDGSERWQGEAFRRFASGHFAEGRGWTYLPRQRRVSIGADGSAAWFDELLDNPELGELRGSGVLMRQGGAWKVAQYNLSVPIPNGLVLSVTEAIRDGSEELPAAGSAAAAAGDPAGSAESAAEPPAKRCPRRHKTNRSADC